MALIKCIECGRDISDKAKCCPGCGNPVSNSNICPECKCNTVNNNVCSNCGYEVVEKNEIIDVEDEIVDDEEIEEEFEIEEKQESVSSSDDEIEYAISNSKKIREYANIMFGIYFFIALMIGFSALGAMSEDYVAGAIVLSIIAVIVWSIGLIIKLRLESIANIELNIAKINETIRKK